MSIETMKAIVLRYLKQVLDNGQVDILDELLTEDCVIHRPEFPAPIVGLDNFKAFLSLAFTAIVCRMETTVHDIMAEGDLLSCRLSHKFVFFENAVLPSRIGTHETGGREVVGAAMAMCRFRDGKIAEEWVFKDEIGLLMQLGAF
ncbi:MAG: ester cyclase [Proteobacteria bacterium]|nr:ester cyclase [Pseudomonadota bacterium]